MSSPEEVLLRDAFRELRSLEEVRAPRFRIAHSAQPAATVLHWTRSIAAAMLTLIIIATFAMLLRTPAPSIDASITDWKGPTDFLLQTPQADLLRTVPQIGERNSTQ